MGDGNWGGEGGVFLRFQEGLHVLVSALKDKLGFLELFSKDEYMLFEGVPQGNYSGVGYKTYLPTPRDTTKNTLF